MSDLPPLPPYPEVRKEFEQWLDDYIDQWSAAVRKFLEEKSYKPQNGGKPQRGR
jgi:hypothetical protein